MSDDLIRAGMERTATGIEVFAIAVIVVAMAFGTARFLLHLRRQTEAAYATYKVHLGRALLLGLEFLVAADIIRTVALGPGLQDVLLLGLLVVIRTFLSWALVVEMEGRWPWNASEGERRG
jgi:uncharacterized membrane protein